MIAGASTRAAAFSAIRAGLSPACCDLFADLDLVASCRVEKIPFADYPHRIEAFIEGFPLGPWMYTGSIENAPDVVEAIGAKRQLWGNGSQVLRRVRDPFFLHQILHEHGFATPRVAPRHEELPQDGSYLVKPIDSGGGEGIEPLLESYQPSGRPSYFQEKIEGTSHSATFVGGSEECQFLGGTRQLTGKEGSAFAYVGSIGPHPFDDLTVETLRKMGEVLQRVFGLRGLFGVDFLLNDAGIWPVEVNPRYTASVEVLELALGCSLLSTHAQAFETTEPNPVIGLPRLSFVAKHVLFASRPLLFPEVSAKLLTAFDPFDFREVADIPRPGTSIGVGEPILTVLAHGETLIECESRLQRISQEWMQRLGQS